MISIKQSKLLNALQLKKYRKENQCFLVEGAKAVSECLASQLTTIHLFATDTFLTSVGALANNAESVTITTEDQLEKAGTLVTNNAAIAIVKIPDTFTKLPNPNTQAINIILDDIKDPGNLGTIIRLADWYGLKTIFCTQNTADCYAPKVIAATMGSFLRVQCVYTNIPAFLDANAKTQVAGAVLNGTSVYQTTLPHGSFLVIGNESNGISPQLLTYISRKVTIPKIGHAESLNAGIATAILVDNIIRLQHD